MHDEPIPIEIPLDAAEFNLIILAHKLHSPDAYIDFHPDVLLKATFERKWGIARPFQAFMINVDDMVEFIEHFNQVGYYGAYIGAYEGANRWFRLRKRRDDDYIGPQLGK